MNFIDVNHPNTAQEIYKIILKNNYSNVCERLEFSGRSVLNLLLAKEIITLGQKEEIENKPSRLGKANELLSFLMRNSNHFPAFVECLRTDKQGTLAQELVDSFPKARTEYAASQAQIQNDLHQLGL
ncbi:DgyrCDS10597 [Dimorphilus gyrociliatus]|uniref:DgyrCDS10597 n=1 Tax=Dimorphilus gyrociliatus TaxID=2664684 RepID=A0A7I8W1T1_9ANNE|nr:DgyrCDS10597 [Dimorphilus gyrociliatus]